MTVSNRVACLIRMPPEMHRLITLRRITNNRSFNAEVVSLLENVLGKQEMSDLEAFMLLRATPKARTPDEL